MVGVIDSFNDIFYDENHANDYSSILGYARVNFSSITDGIGLRVVQ